MIDPNKIQVGGDHYKSTYNHWDFCVNTAQDYITGNATKYISRWRKKGGIEDLKKALHYVQKLNSVRYQVAPFRGSSVFSRNWINAEVFKFLNENNITPEESSIIGLLAIWETEADILRVEKALNDLVESVEREQLIAQTVPLTEENHYGERITEEELLKRLEPYTNPFKYDDRNEDPTQYNHPRVNVNPKG